MYFVFCIFLALSVLIAKTPSVFIAFYAGVSLFTFIMYAVDKSADQKGDWRTPESIFHFLSLSGGWPGALIAKQKSHHKSKMKSFKTVFWIAVTINLCAFIGLLTPEGSSMLLSLVVNLT